MNKIKETALTVAGLASVLAAGQTVAHAASTYTVQDGDTLSELAQKFNLTVEDLVKSNKISDANLVFVDQKISIPTSAVADSTTNDSAVASQAAESAASSAADSLAAASSAAAASDAAASSAAASSAAASQAAASSAAAATTTTVSASSTAAVAGTGSTYDQFIAAGGTAALWQYVVMPESGGNPNAVSPNGYHGLGQTMQAWGYGSVATQTQGMVNYAVSRYGSIDAAVQFRLANGWW